MKRSILVLSACAALGMLPAKAFAFDWNGFYAGVSGGYSAGFSHSAYDSSSFPFGGVTFDSHPSGFFGGVQVGANRSVWKRIVLGLEGDISYGGITDTIPDVLGSLYHGGSQTITSTTDFLGTIRARVGLDAGKFLPYLTAGVAGAQTKVSATDGNLSQSAFLLGWTAGAGVEFAINDRVTLKAEYLYGDLGDHTWFAGQA